MVVDSSSSGSHQSLYHACFPVVSHACESNHPSHYVFRYVWCTAFSVLCLLFLRVMFRVMLRVMMHVTLHISLRAASRNDHTTCVAASGGEGLSLLSVSDDSNAVLLVRATFRSFPLSACLYHDTVP